MCDHQPIQSTIARKLDVGIQLSILVGLGIVEGRCLDWNLTVWNCCD